MYCNQNEGSILHAGADMGRMRLSNGKMYDYGVTYNGDLKFIKEAPPYIEGYKQIGPLLFTPNFPCPCMYRTHKTYIKECGRPGGMFYCSHFNQAVTVSICKSCPLEDK